MLAENPSLAANALATVYYRPHLAAESKSEVKHEGTSLDALIAGAIKSQGSEALSEESKHTLDRLFGANTPRDEQLRQMDQLEKDLMRDPHEVSARLMSAFGGPATPLQIALQKEQQQEEHAFNSNFVQWRDQQLANNPRVAQMYPAIVSVLERPDFISSGNAATDLQRAYTAVEGALQYGADIHAVLDHGVEQLREHELHQHIAQFAEAIGVKNFESARVTMGELIEQGRAADLGEAYTMAQEIKLRRAQRARGPKSGGTRNNTSNSSADLDSIIGSAINKYGM
jgi:hypothetical protein